MIERVDSSLALLSDPSEEAFPLTSVSADRGRITARVPIQVRETLEMAAGIVGATMNQFIVQTALREAERVIEQERVIRLSARDAEAFLRALDAPPPPNDELTAALEDYLTRRDDQTGTLDWRPRQKRV
ncbi:DUF1778 domain-containing protein [Candidatus Thiosymbion oneisti]|uniref:type II toxin-antitoxin system TacA family antitoxin n=1 Tax=Candidatus Thiosymbion oneisti TaxID=589554 RepID=UPI001A9CA6F1|nr:DUF1778 domain-containing protein [Candidatus Thiosymbion oneisti]